MLKRIEGLPSDVLAIEAIGKVNHEDYRDLLIPWAEAMMGQGPIKLLYIFGKDFTGYELEALWDDAAFGVRNWHDFSRVAVVGDQAWLHTAIGMFRPFVPYEVRLFRLVELDAAKQWISHMDMGIG